MDPIAELDEARALLWVLTADTPAPLAPRPACLPADARVVRLRDGSRMIATDLRGMWIELCGHLPSRWLHTTTDASAPTLAELVRMVDHGV